MVFGVGERKSYRVNGLSDSEQCQQFYFIAFLVAQLNAEES